MLDSLHDLLTNHRTNERASERKSERTNAPRSTNAHRRRRRRPPATSSPSSAQPPLRTAAAAASMTVAENEYYLPLRAIQDSDRQSCCRRARGLLSRGPDGKGGTPRASFLQGRRVIFRAAKDFQFPHVRKGGENTLVKESEITRGKTHLMDLRRSCQHRL